MEIAVHIDLGTWISISGTSKPYGGLPTLLSPDQLEKFTATGMDGWLTSPAPATGCSCRAGSNDWITMTRGQLNTYHQRLPSPATAGPRPRLTIEGVELWHHLKCNFRTEKREKYVIIESR